MLGVFEVGARLFLDDAEFNRGMDRASKSTNTFANMLRANLVTKGIEVAISGMKKLASTATNTLKSVVDSYANYEQLVGGVETLFGTRGAKSVEEYAAMVGKSVSAVQDEFKRLKSAENKVLKNADEAYRTAGLSANQYMETVTSFSASLIKSVKGNTVKAAKLADMAITDMSDNANKMGSDMRSIQNAYAGFAKQNYMMLDNLKLGYGGTKSEMDRLIKDAMKIDKSFKARTKTVKKHGKSIKELNYSYADIVKAIHIVQDNMGITGTTAKEAADTIQGSIASTKAAWENVLVAIGSGKNVKEATGNLIENIKNVLKNVKPVIKRGIRGLGDFVVKILPTALKEVPDIALSLFQTLFKTVPQLVVQIAQTIPKAVSEGIEKIRGVLLTYGVQKIALFLNMIITGGADKSYGPAQQRIQFLLTRLFKRVFKLGGKLSELWTKVLKPFASKVVDLIFNYLLPAVDRILTALEPAFKWIGDNIDDLFDEIEKLWENVLFPIFKWIVDNIESVVAAVGTAVALIAGMNIAKKISDTIAIVKTLFGVLKANPIGIIITVIAALVGYVVHLYKTNEKARDKINAAFRAIKNYWNKTLKPAFEDMYKYVVETLIPTIVKWWEEELKPKLEAVFKAIKEFWYKTLKPALKNMYKYVGETLIPSLITWWDTQLKPTIETVFNAIKGFWEDTLKPALKDIYDYVVADLIPTLIVWWEDHLKPTIETVFTAIAGFWNDILKPAFRAIWSYVVVKLIPALQEKWEAIQPVIEGVFTAIKTFWEEIAKPAFDDLWTFIQTIILPLFQRVGKKVQYVLDTYLQPVVTWIANSFITAWEGVQTQLSSLIEFINGVFSGDWEKAWNGLVGLVKAPFDTLATILKTPINAVIDLINGMIRSVRDAINTVIGAINNALKITIPDVKIGDVFAGEPLIIKDYKHPAWEWSANLPTIKWSDNVIPKLAKGGIVRNGGKAIVGEYQPEFLQMIGNRAVVTPLSSTPGRFPGGTPTRVAATGAGGGSRDISIILEIDSREFAKAVYKANNDERQRVGVRLSNR